MITLHRLGHKLELFHLNPDLIVTVEGHPDTVITLATGAKIVVAETPERVCQAVRAYRVEILAGAMKRRQDQREENPRVRTPSDRSCGRPARQRRPTSLAGTRCS